MKRDAAAAITSPPSLQTAIPDLLDDALLPEDGLGEPYLNVDQPLADQLPERDSSRVDHYDHVRDHFIRLDAHTRHGPWQKEPVYPAKAPDYSYKLAYQYLYLAPDVAGFPDVVEHLEAHDEFAEALGFSLGDIPGPSTFSRKWTEDFDEVRQWDIAREVAEVGIRLVQAGVEIDDEQVRDIIAAGARDSIITTNEDDEDDVGPTDSEIKSVIDTLEEDYLMDVAQFDTAPNAQADDLEIGKRVAEVNARGTTVASGLKKIEGVARDKDLDIRRQQVMRALKSLNPDETDDPEQRTLDNFDSDPRREGFDVYDLFDDGLFADPLSEAQEDSYFSRQTVVALDDTDQPYYYGNDTDEDPPEYAVGVSGEPYSHVVREMTLGVQDVERGQSYKLNSRQIRKGDGQAEKAIELLDEAEDHVDIGCVHWDRWFSIAELCDWCNKNHVDFFSRMKRTKGVKKVEQRGDLRYMWDACPYTITGSDGTEANVTLVRVPHDEYFNLTDSEGPDYKRRLHDDQRSIHHFDETNEDYEDGSDRARQGGLEQWDAGLDRRGRQPDDPEVNDDEDDQQWVYFITNVELDMDDPQEIRGWAQRYRRRWLIETQYRCIKEGFMGETNSRDFGVREYYWLLAVLMYCIWILLDILLRVRYPGYFQEDRPALSAELAGHFLFETD